MGKTRRVKSKVNGVVRGISSVLYRKISLDRDQNGLKRTRKGAKHRQNAAKQPEKTTLTNHERMLLRKAQREKR